MNSFLALREQEVKTFVDERQDRVRARVESRLRTLQFWGDVVELFVPMMADTVTSLTGGEPTDPAPDYFTILEGERESEAGGGPTDRDEIIR